jgi:hypothetical protein
MWENCDLTGVVISCLLRLLLRYSECCGQTQESTELLPSRPPLFLCGSLWACEQRPRCVGARGRRALWPSDRRSPSGCLRSPRPALLGLTRGEQSAPPRPPGRSWWSGGTFPLGFGQQLARRALPGHALGVRMASSFAVALGEQQRVRVHRPQVAVADRTRVGLRLRALGRTDVPPAHGVGHRARLRRTEPPAVGVRRSARGRLGRFPRPERYAANLSPSTTDLGGA